MKQLKLDRNLSRNFLVQWNALYLSWLMLSATYLGRKSDYLQYFKPKINQRFLLSFRSCDHYVWNISEFHNLSLFTWVRIFELSRISSRTEQFFSAMSCNVCNLLWSMASELRTERPDRISWWMASRLLCERISEWRLCNEIKAWVATAWSWNEENLSSLLQANFQMFSVNGKETRPVLDRFHNSSKSVLVFSIWFAPICLRHHQLNTKTLRKYAKS